MRIVAKCPSRLVRRLGSAALLVGFLAHAGDGLMAALCSPGMDHAASGVAMAVPAHGPDEAECHRAGHGQGPESAPCYDHGAGSHDVPCPFGSGSVAVCGAAATVPSLSVADAPALVLGATFLPSEPADSLGTLLALKQFRPPRA